MNPVIACVYAVLIIVGAMCVYVIAYDTARAVKQAHLAGLARLERARR